MEIEEIFSAIQSHRDVVGKAVAKLVSTSFHEEPDLELAAPAGFVLKSLDDAPMISKSMTDSESQEFHSLLDAAISKAEEMAARDADYLAEQLDKACVLAPVEHVIAEFICSGVPACMR